MTLRAAQGTQHSWTTVHPVLAVVLVYVSMRAVDVLALVWVGSSTGQSLGEVLLSWDAAWHVRLADEGYPEDVPLGAGGVPVQTTWAWPPGYPLLGRLLAAPWGADAHGPAMVATAVVAGGAAAVVLMLALRGALGVRAAVTMAAVWSALPGATVLVMAYAEGLFALLAFGALWAAVRDRFVLAALLLLPAGLVKTSVVPYAIALVIAVWWTRVRPEQKPVALPTAAVVTAVSILAVVAWPLVVAVRLGSLDAYSTVQSAWGRSSIPFRDTAAWLVHPFARGYADDLLAYAALAVAIVAAVVVWRDRRFPRMVRLLGVTSPVTLLATGASVSTSRWLLGDVAVPGLGWRLTRGPVSVVVVLAALSVVRIIWTGVFLTGAPFPPP